MLGCFGCPNDRPQCLGVLVTNDSPRHLGDLVTNDNPRCLGDLVTNSSPWCLGNLVANGSHWCLGNLVTNGSPWCWGVLVTWSHAANGCVSLAAVSMDQTSTPVSDLLSTCLFVCVCLFQWTAGMDQMATPTSTTATR